MTHHTHEGQAAAEAPAAEMQPLLEPFPRGKAWKYSDEQLRERDRMWTERLAALEKDKARLDWLLHNLDGGALRRIGVITSGEPALNRSAIDAAIASQSKGE